MRLLTLMIMVSLISSCSSGPEKVKELDENYRSGTYNSDERVGLRGNDIVIQKRTYMEDRLWKLRQQVDDLQQTIYGNNRKDPGGIWLALKACRKRMADPRIGGKGIPRKMESWENILQENEEFEFALDDRKNVVVVKEEKLVDRVGKLKKARKLLTKRYDAFTNKADTCETKYHASLIQHGLDPKDTKAKGEWVVGPQGYRVWRMVTPSTDNPEELANRKQKRERDNQNK